jgi:hypothetical protein
MEGRSLKMIRLDFQAFMEAVWTICLKTKKQTSRRNLPAGAAKEFPGATS